MLLYGILLAVLCAFVTQIAGLCKYKGARTAPSVSFGHPIRSARDLFRSGWFTIGMVGSISAFGLHVAAMKFAPISWVQIILASGIVMLAVLADLVFGYRMQRRQWIGVGMITAGLLAFIFTVPGSPVDTQMRLLPMILFSSLLMLGGISCLGIHAKGGLHAHGAPLMGAVAGVFVAIGDLAMKACLSGHANGIWIAVGVAVAIAGFFTAARGFQLGEAVEVLTMMALATNVVCVLGGWLAFLDPIPSSAITATVHIGGFVLLIGAAWLIPCGQVERQQNQAALS